LGRTFTHCDVHDAAPPTQVMGLVGSEQNVDAISCIDPEVPTPFASLAFHDAFTHVQLASWLAWLKSPLLSRFVLAASNDVHGNKNAATER